MFYAADNAVSKEETSGGNSANYFAQRFVIHCCVSFRVVCELNFIAVVINRQIVIYVEPMAILDYLCVILACTYHSTLVFCVDYFVIRKAAKSHFLQRVPFIHYAAAFLQKCRVIHI